MGGLLPPSIPANAGISVLTAPTFARNLGQSAAEAGMFHQRHLFGVGDHTARADYVSDIAVHPLHRFLGSQCSAVAVITASTCSVTSSTHAGSRRSAAHNPHAVVAGEGRRRDREQDGVDIDSDGAGRGEPIEQAAGDRARPAREVEHRWCSTRDRLDDIEQPEDSQLTIGDQVLFEAVPRPLPPLGPTRIMNDCHTTMVGGCIRLSTAG